MYRIVSVTSPWCMVCRLRVVVSGYMVRWYAVWICPLLWPSLDRFGYIFTVAVLFTTVKYCDMASFISPPRDILLHNICSTSGLESFCKLTA